MNPQPGSLPQLRKTDRGECGNGLSGMFQPVGNGKELWGCGGMCWVTGSESPSQLENIPCPFPLPCLTAAAAPAGSSWSQAFPGIFPAPSVSALRSGSWSRALGTGSRGCRSQPFPAPRVTGGAWVTSARLENGDNARRELLGGSGMGRFILILFILIISTLFTPESAPWRGRRVTVPRPLPKLHGEIRDPLGGAGEGSLGVFPSRAK